MGLQPQPDSSAQPSLIRTVRVLSIVAGAGRGTATEVMPIRSLDKIRIGTAGAEDTNTSRGPITETIQRRYQDIINGRADDQFGWLTYA